MRRSIFGLLAALLLVTSACQTSDTEQTNNTQNNGQIQCPLSGQCNTRHLFGMNIDPANPAGNPGASELKEAGVRWVRIEFKTGDGLGYAYFDPIIEDLRGAGLKVLLIVDYATVYGRPGPDAPESEWNNYLTQFEQKTSELAQHYGDSVDAWQIWNEPDLPAQSGYDVYIPPNYYGRMLRDATSAIRAHSTSPVITGGLATGDPTYLTDVKNEIGSLPVDGVAVHPYGQRAPDDWPSADWGFGNMSTLIDNYRQYGDNLPIWITEIGTIDEGRQADYLANVYDMVWSRFPQGVAHVFWFCWSDGMVSPYGIHDGQGTPKPAYTAYRDSAPSWGACEEADDGGGEDAGGSDDAGGDTGDTPSDTGGSDTGLDSSTSDTRGGDEDDGGVPEHCR